MLTHHLTNAIQTLQDLIDVTRNDIDDIKEAKHDNIFSRAQIKEQLVQSFENIKSMIDNEIAKQVQSNPDKELTEILDEEQQNHLDTMRNKLEELKKVNRYFGNMVIAVSEFYSSLLAKLIPSENVGYGKQQYKSASFLQIKG